MSVLHKYTYGSAFCLFLCFYNSIKIHAQYTSLDTCWAYTSWEHLPWGKWALPHRTFRMKQEGEYSFIIDGIYSPWTGIVQTDSTMGTELINYNDEYYYNFQYYSKHEEDMGFFVKMNLVGYYSVLLFPKQRGEIEIYRSRIVVWAIMELIESLISPEWKDERMFLDSLGNEYQVLFFDPFHSPKKDPKRKGPKPVWLDEKELTRIIASSDKIELIKPAEQYTVEEILKILITLNRYKEASYQEGNLEYLDGF